MTFLKFIIWKIKTTSSNYWMLLGLKIFVRIFGMITLLYTMNLLVKVNTSNPEHLHKAISSVFYLAFFVFLDTKTKVSSGFSLSEKIVKPINILKWLSLLIVGYLIYLKIEINAVGLSAVDLSTPAFLFTKIWPVVIIPNLSFIIITVLILYASAILNRNKRLKEENDLTI